MCTSRSRQDEVVHVDGEHQLLVLDPVAARVPIHGLGSELFLEDFLEVLLPVRTTLRVTVKALNQAHHGPPIFALP